MFRTALTALSDLSVTGVSAPVATAVTSGGQVICGLPGSRTVTVCVHVAVLPALSQAVEWTVPLGTGAAAAAPKAVGVVETFSGVSVLLAADVAAKTGQVTLLRIHLAMALGGKGYVLMAGSVSDVQMAVHAAAEVVRRKGLLVAAVSIPGPSRELLAEYI